VQNTIQAGYLNIWHPRKSFPHFYRWIKLSAVGDPSFVDAIDARDVLYNLLALRTRDMRPRRSFVVGNLESIRPSAEMLTSLEVNANAVPVEIPPLYDAQPFETSVRHGHGKFAFTADNEVLYFADKAGCDGFVISYDSSPHGILTTRQYRHSPRG